MHHFNLIKPIINRELRSALIFVVNLLNGKNYDQVTFDDLRRT